MNTIFCLEALERIKYGTMQSIKSMMNAFENGCADYQQIIRSKACVLSHVKEIELQTKCVRIFSFIGMYDLSIEDEYFRSDSLLIAWHVQSVMDECVWTKNNINMIVMSHDRVRRTNKTVRKEVKSNFLIYVKLVFPYYFGEFGNILTFQKTLNPKTLVST